MKIEQPPYACDVCGKRRDQDVNHWFIVTISKNPVGVTIYQWSDPVAEFLKENTTHACGQVHALLLVTRWITRGSFVEHPVAEVKS